MSTLESSTRRGAADAPVPTEWFTSAPPGSLRGLYLVVDDIEAARTELSERGAAVSEIFHEARLGARFRPAGDAGRAPGPDTARQTYSSFLSFDDPDGNGWIVQEITTRLPGRE